MDESDPERDAIHDAIAANSDHVQDASGGAILTGWVVISEWMDKDGARYLAHCRAASTSPWTARGMMHDVLFRPEDSSGLRDSRAAVWWGSRSRPGLGAVVRAAGNSYGLGPAKPRGSRTVSPGGVRTTAHPAQFPRARRAGTRRRTCTALHGASSGISAIVSTSQ